MNKNVKNILSLGVCALFLLCFSLWGMLKEDDALSLSERRPLKQFPLLSTQEVLSGRFQSNFESYTLDQFPLRDTFRTLKALAVSRIRTRRSIFRSSPTRITSWPPKTAIPRSIMRSFSRICARRLTLPRMSTCARG